MTLRAAMMGGVLAAAVLSSGPALPQLPSAGAMAAAKELVAAARSADQLKMLLPLFVQQLKPVIVQGRPEVERDFDRIMPAMLDAMTARLGDFTEAMAAVYARNFTIDELRQIRAFYHTSAGQKLLEKMPVIAQESLALGQKLGQLIANEMKGRFIEELRKRGHTI